MNRYIITILMMMLTAESGRTAYSAPYKLYPVTDSILMGSGAALYGISLYTENNIDPLSDQEITTLSDKNINRFDRSAADNQSPSADNWSYGILISMMMSPAAFLIGDNTRNDIFTIGVMYAESVLITQGLNGTTKNIVQRNRPFTYNQSAPLADKKDKDAVLSFYSGHTVHAFNSAMFINTVFYDYYPESSWRYAVYGTTLSAAGLTGFLRYKSGKHYPSDIIAGAVIGSATGWLIPVLHHTETGNISIQITAGEENMFAVVLNF